jgi:hypothetical protein
MFPAGSAGWALLFLRIGDALLCVVAVNSLPDLPRWLAVVLLLLAALLLVGFLTPIVAAACAITAAAAGVDIGGPVGSVVALHALNGFALAMLGAGAYSVDAWLFGRRIISLDG